MEIPILFQREVWVEILKERYGDKEIYGIELGCLWGDTAGYLLKNIPSLYLISIDISPIEPIITENVGVNMKRFTYLQSTTDFAAPLVKEKVDFVLVDADHSYEQCKKDILNYLPLIKDDGFIGGHDYGTNSFPGVKQVVDEIFGSLVIKREDFTWYVKNILRG